jgi:hypothetical protein
MSDGRRRCVSDYGSEGWGFESLRARKKVLVRAGPQGPAFPFGSAYVTQRDRDTPNKQEPGEGLTDQVGMAAWWPKTLTRADSLGRLVPSNERHLGSGPRQSRDGRSRTGRGCTGSVVRCALIGREPAPEAPIGAQWRQPERRRSVVAFCVLGRSAERAGLGATGRPRSADERVIYSRTDRTARSRTSSGIHLRGP